MWIALLNISFLALWPQALILRLPFRLILATFARYEPKTAHIAAWPSRRPKSCYIMGNSIVFMMGSPKVGIRQRMAFFVVKMTLLWTSRRGASLDFLWRGTWIGITENQPPIYPIFSSLEAALGECERRLARPWVKDRASGRFVHRGEVRVAAITGLETFSRHRVFLTSLSELHRTHVLNHDDDFASRPEWLVLDHIPPSCVLADGTATQFIEFCRAWV